MSADSDAFRTVQALPGLTDRERQYLMVIARGEGFYGLGWGNPNPLTVRLSEEFGIDPRAGAGSKNWGAEQGQGTAGSFPHVDHDSSGKPFVAQYRRYKTDLEGAAGFSRILLKPNLKQALATGFYPGPIARFPRPTPAQKAQFEFKKQFSGQNLTPLKAAVLTQSDNGYYELHPEKYLKAATTNYDKLTASLKWPTLLTSQEGVAVSLPLAGSPSSASRPLSSGEPSQLHRPVLRLASTNRNAIKILQELLNKQGYAVAVDGYFGRLTQEAVMLFQADNQLHIDGVVGPLTWNKLGG